MIKLNKQSIIVFLFLFFSAVLGAQTDQSIADTVDITEIVVTHSKVPLPEKQTAKPIQVITQQQIERSAGKDLSQLLHEEAGLLINGAYSNLGKDKALYLQGAGGDYTLVLLDGQPIVDPSGLGGSFDLRLFSLEQLERVEILKGSQSTLYGSDAIAGVINLITRKSGDKALGGYGGLAYGSFNTLKANVGLNGSLNKLDYNLNIARNSTDGISEALDKDGNNNFDDDGFEKLNLNANLKYTPTEKLSISPFLRYNDFEGDFDADAFTDAPNTFTAEFINPGLNASFQTEKLLASATYGYTKTDREFKTSFGDSPFRGRFHNVDAFASYQANDFIKIIGGVNYQDLQVLDTNAVIVDPAAQITSPYLTILLQGYKRLNLELGYRFNNHSKFGSNSNVTAAAGYWLSDQIKLRASYTTGFKAPTLFQLYGQFGANENLDPQKSASIQAGLTFQTSNENLLLDVGLFNRKVEDIIVYAFVPGYFNQDEQNDTGVEAQLKWRVNEQLSVNGRYSFLTGEVTTKNQLEQDTSFNNLIRRPKHHFYLAINYQPTDRLFFSVQGQQVGERADLFFNPANFYAAEEVTLESYFLLNAYAEYRLFDGQMTLFVDAKNLTDADFSEVYGFNGLGFNVLGGLRFRW